MSDKSRNKKLPGNKAERSVIFDWLSLPYFADDEFSDDEAAAKLADMRDRGQTIPLYNDGYYAVTATDAEIQLIIAWAYAEAKKYGVPFSRDQKEAEDNGKMETEPTPRRS